MRGHDAVTAKQDGLNGRNPVGGAAVDDKAYHADRRDFFKAATAGLTTAAVLLSSRDGARAQEAAQKAALERMASNSWPIRPLFKQRSMPRPPGAAADGAAGGRAAAAQAAMAEIEANPNAARALDVAKKATAARANLPNAAEMKKKYGEITMLDFPQFTKDT